VWRKFGITLSFLIGLVTACTPTPGPKTYFKHSYKAYVRGNYTDALREFRHLAEQGHGKSQYYLATMYANGEGVPQDVSEASKWYFHAAENDIPEAQHTLGIMYTYGSVVARDLSEAAAWFTRAAHTGYKPSQLKMAEILSDQSSQAYDPIRAYMWYTIFMQNTAGDTRAEVLKNRQKLMSTMSHEDILAGEHLVRTWQATPSID